MSIFSEFVENTLDYAVNKVSDPDTYGGDEKDDRDEKDED